MGELVELVLSPEWTERRLAVNDVLSVESDFKLCLRRLRRKALPRS